MSTSVSLYVAAFTIFIGLGAVLGCSVGEAEKEQPTMRLEQSDAASPGEVTYERYRNVRFDFELLYPASLLRPAGEAEGRAGQSFVNPDTSFQVRAYGRHNLGYELIEQAFDERIGLLEKESREIISQEVGEEGYQITSRGPERMFYERTMLRNDVLLTLEVEVTEEHDEELSPVIDNMMASFKG